MSQFSDLVDSVYTLTSRQDLIAETALAIRQATYDAHRSDLYPQDLQDGIQIAVASPGLSIWQLDIPTNFPQWRKFSHIRPYDALTSSLAKIVIGRYEFLSPDAILDDYLQEKVNVAYVAGSNLNVRLQSAFTGLLVGYWKNPIVGTDATYSSWIARDYADVIVVDATRRVFTMIGYEESAARLTQILFGSSNGSWQNVQGGVAATFKTAVLESAGG